MRGQTHVYSVRTLSASVVQDSDGYPVRGAPVDVEVEGYVAEVSAEEIAALGAMGQTIDVVAQAPLGTVVDDRDFLVVTEPTRLAGLYRVEAVRTLRKGLRILGRRTTSQD